MVLIEQVYPGPFGTHADHAHDQTGQDARVSLTSRTLQPGVETGQAGEELTGSWLMTDSIGELSASLDARGSREHHLIRALQSLTKNASLE